jgi:hypothetical protein
MSLRMVDWACYFSKSRAVQMLGRADVTHIDWGKETESEDFSSTSTQSAR